MEALLVLLLLLTVSFGAGYGAREMISRKRRAEYRKHRSSSPKPPLFAFSEPPGINDRAKAEGGRTTHDITDSFQEVHIQEHRAPQVASLHLVSSRPEQVKNGPSGEPAGFEECLEELRKPFAAWSASSLIVGVPHALGQPVARSATPGSERLWR